MHLQWGDKLNTPISPWRGIMFMNAATLVFTINDTFLKISTDALPPFEALFLRGVFSSLFALPLLLVTRTADRAHHMFDRRVMLRNALESVAVLFFIVALANISIADITAMVQLAPMLLVAGVAIFFKEKVGLSSWIFIFLGFLGALLVAQPGGEGFSIYMVFGMATALATAARDLVGRRVSAHIPGPVVASGTLILVTVVAGVFHLAFEDFVMPDLFALGCLAASGLFLMFGHLFVFLAYRTGDIGATAPFFYGFTVWSVLSSWLIFSHLPNQIALIGMAMILISGVSVALLSERSRRLRVLA